MNTQVPYSRYPEIDLLRMIALCGMAVYHTAFMGWYLYGWQIDVLNGAWWLLARITSNTFLLLVGVSFVLAALRQPTAEAVWKRTVKRSMTVLSAAVLVTIVTSIIDPHAAVQFGILHCIGTAMLLLPLFRYAREWNLLIGTLWLIIGFHTTYLLKADTDLLLPLGIIPPDFRTLDFFPLVPWFGVILIGAGIGSFLYERWKFTPLLHARIWKSITWPGRHALPLYLLHPAVIYLVLKIL